MGPRLPTALILAVLAALLALAAALPARAGGLDAIADRTRLAENETIQFSLKADGRPSGEPDLSPLQEDFEVLSNSSVVQVTVVNGALTQTRSWNLELAPRRTGRLTIPSLSLGGARSQPIPVEVVPASQAQAGGPRPLLLETEVTATAPYVQQAFEYKVRVLFREQPRRAVLSDPEAEGASLEPVGDDQSFAREIGGVRYTAIERRWRVIPQKSGPLTIRSPRLEAVLADPGRRRSPLADFDSLFGGPVFRDLPAMPDLGGGRRVVERGPDRSVEVRPQPVDATADHWLPAESIQLADEWSPSPPVFRVGEPVTRTLTITAQGTTAAQLPALDLGAPDGMSLYPEAPQAEDLSDQGRPAALKTLKTALVPARAGTFVLPEIRLPWWDTVEDRARVAVIPARTVTVEPAAAGTAAAPGAAPAEAAAVARTPGSGEDIAAAGRGGATDSSGSARADSGGKGAGQGSGSGSFDADNPWPWVALVLGLGWIATWVRLILERRRGGPASARSGPRPVRDGAQGRSVPAAAALRRACTDGDPRAARRALVQWARARWSTDPPLGLKDLAARLGGEAGAILADLDRAVYAPESHAWDGHEVWRRLAPLLDRAPERARTRDTGTSPLPALYPQGL